jgi:hypothetical protein
VSSTTELGLILAQVSEHTTSFSDTELKIPRGGAPQIV